MFCTNCGNQMDDDALFCTSCGAQVERDDQEVSAVNTAQLQVEQPAPQPVQPAPQAAFQQGFQQTKVMPQVMQPQFAAAQVTPQGSVAQAVPAGSSLLVKKIILIALIAIIIVLIIATACFMSCSKKAIAIDTITNVKIRDAVTVNLDIDGDGMLSPDEANVVVGVTSTPEGIKFITTRDNASSANDALAEYEANWKPDVTGNGGPTGGGINDQVFSNPDEDYDELLTLFPNMQTLDARGAGLTKLDLSKAPNLEYVDCTQNSISTLDLSKNNNLTSMFCDENVTLTGLDNAGLYFRDLMTSYDDSTSIDYGFTGFQYDALGRVITGGGKTFKYDETGRLTRAESLTGEDPWYEEYTYNSDGLLENASVYQPLEVGGTPFEYSYEYGDKNRLTVFSESISGNVFMSGSIDYSGDVISSIKITDGVSSISNQKFSLESDGKGRISEISGIAGDGTSTKYFYTYLDDGECTSQSASTGRYIEENGYSTTYTSDGIPQSTAVDKLYSTLNDNHYSFDVVYETNADGYVTKMTTPSNDGSTMLSGTTVNVSYVKHVSKLEDLPLQRYVPVFRVENTDSLFYEMTWHLTSDLYASTGSAPSISILEDGPMQVTFQALGLAPNVVSNANEQKLADYLAEHWSDPIEVKDAATASTSAQSASNANAANEAARTIETEYFTFVMPESWVDKVEMKYEHHSNPGVTYKGDPSQELHYYLFNVKGNDQGFGDVIEILVTNDATAELGETWVLGEFTTSEGLEGYVCYADWFLLNSAAVTSDSATIASLQSGGQVKFSPSDTQSQGEANNKIIEAWLKQNVVPNIHPK